MPRATATRRQSLLHEIQAYIGTYTHDFTEIGDLDTGDDQEREGDPLTVWIGLGRDQAQVLKQMTQESLHPKRAFQETTAHYRYERSDGTCDFSWYSP